MKAPVRCQPWARGFRWEPPDKEWLEHHYVSLRKSAETLSEEVGAGASTVRRWLRNARIPRRSSTEHMFGEGNPNWVDGRYVGQTRHKARDLQYAKEGARVCAWCGQEADPSLGRRGALDVHHKDHDKSNNIPENLMWLCRWCHLLEQGLWHLLKQGKINLTCEGRTMVIEFK